METGLASETGAAEARFGLLFTRYPVPTETFLQREVDALKEVSTEAEVIVIWGREDASRPSDFRFRLRHLWRLIWCLPYWLLRRPRAMVEMAEALVNGSIPTVLNFFENLLGLGVALCWAGPWSARYRHLHAVWASGPGTVAWAVNRLTGIPYSLAGHAYDLFEGGGDGWLKWKLRGATFVRSSTMAGLRRWEQLGAGAPRHLIRRGLAALPQPWQGEPPRPPYRLLTVGRMVEKMGHAYLCAVLFELKRLGVSFQFRLVGDGPLRGETEARLERMGLLEEVKLEGALPFEAVERCYAAADLFIFSGVVARNGDRAGFPNAIAEAMAWGVPVAATSVGGVAEVIQDDQNGIVLTFDPSLDARRIASLLEDPAACGRFSRAGREWIETHFRADRAMQELLRLINANS